MPLFEGDEDSGYEFEIPPELKEALEEIERISQGYEFPIPPEMRAWLDHQKEEELGHHAYILKNGKITKTSWLEASIWWGLNRKLCKIDSTQVGEAKVSTVFIPLDHNFNNFFESWQGEPEGVDRRPILFETLVFGGDHDGEMDRYASLGEAKQGHWRMVDLVKGNKNE